MPTRATGAADAPPPHPHVVVIGGGLAGASAALSAADAMRAGGPRTARGRVTLLDKEASGVGGNSAKASSGVSAVTAATQTAGDSVAAFAADLEASAGGRGDPTLRAALAASSADALAWLETRAGVALPSVTRLGGHSVDRTHGPAGGAPVGGAVMKAMASLLASDDRVTVRAGTRATRLTMDDRGAVAGVACEGEGAGAAAAALPADAVVLATGGYAAAPALLPPAAAALPTTNGPFATGDGLALGRAAGGAVVDLDAVQLHPTAFEPAAAAASPAAASPPSASLFLAPERLRGVGGVLVNAGGDRFVDELERRSVVAAAVADQPGGAAWLVLSPAAAAAYGDGAIGFYVAKGLLARVDGVAGAASFIGGGPAVATALAAALASHDAAAAGTEPDRHGRSAFAAGAFGVEGGVTDRPPFVVGRVRPAVHYTMGGLAIDAEGRVLREGGAANTPVPGLYAAGEVAGGVHGGNRLGGCSLLDCVVFGRGAGGAAVADWVGRR